MEKPMTQASTRTARRSREPGLLTTESRKEFLGFRKAIYDEIQPCNAIERRFVDWIVMLAWEVLRFLRIKAALINDALLEALENLLKQALPSDGFDFPYQRDNAAADLAARWFVDDEARGRRPARAARPRPERD
jgi:hypothetical protein